MKEKILRILFTLVLVLSSSLLTLWPMASPVHAATITSTATGGSWNTGTTWVGGVVPLATDSVVIATTGGNSVTGTIGTYTCAGLTVNSGAILTMNRSFTVNGPTSITGRVNWGSTNSTSRAMTFNDAVTLNSGAVWTEVATGNGANDTFTFANNFTNNATTFTGVATGLHTFSGTGMTISGSTTTSIPNVRVTGTYTNSGTLTVTTALTGTGGLTQDTSAILNIGGTSTITTVTATAIGNTVNYTGAAQTVRATTYHNLTLSGSGTKTLAGATTINGNLTINTGTTLDVSTSNYGLTVGSNWSNSGAFTPRNGTVTFNGTSPQTMTGATTFYNLTLNNSSGLSLNNNATITNVLTLTNGKITTGTNTVIIGTSGTVSHTNGYVIGNLQKYIATGSNVSRTFEVGTANAYDPVTVTFASVTTAGNLTAKATLNDHPNIGTSCLDSAKSVNVYWTLTNSGIAFNNYNAVFTFTAPDVDSGANTANFIIGNYNNPNWTCPTIGTRTSTSTQATGLTSFGDFAVAEPRQLNCTITAPSSVYRNSTGNPASVPEAGGGATYAWTISNGTITDGQGTRQITWSAGTATPVTIGITITLGGCQCTRSVQVTVTTPPVLSVSISGERSFCEGGSTTLTANVGGGIPPYTYDWSASTAPGTHQDNQYTATGAGTVAVKVTDSDTCTSTIVSDTNTIVTRGNGTIPHNAVLAWVHPNWFAAPPTGLDYNFGYPGNTAQWIWETDQVVHPEDGDVVFFERTFNVPSNPLSATLRITADNGYEVYMNGNYLGWAQLADYNGILWEDSPLTDNWVYSSGWQTVETYNPSLQVGTNTLLIQAANEQNSGGTVTSNPGAIIYEMVYTYHCTASDSVDVTVNPRPTATASSNSPVEEGDTILLTGGPGDMSSYSWTGPDGFTSHAQSPSIPNATISMSGQYSLTVTNSYGCQDTTSTDVVVNAASIPTVTGVEIFEDPLCERKADSMTPQVEYYGRVSVTLSNNLEHLQTVQLTLFYNPTGADDMAAPTVGDTQTCAILSCTVGSLPVWNLSSGSPTSWAIVTSECIQPPLNTPNGAWIFAFKPGKVAEENTGVADWDAQGKAIRNPSQTGEAYVRNKDMNWYGEISGITTPIDWGEVPLGFRFEDIPNPKVVSIKYISNGPYYEDIRSEDWMSGGETVTLSSGDPPANPGEFALMADDILTWGSAIAVKDSYDHINDTRGLTSEDGVIIASNGLWLSLSTSGILPGTYSGDIYYQISKRL